jgi:hypothetical protein
MSLELPITAFALESSAGGTADGQGAALTLTLPVAPLPLFGQVSLAPALQSLAHTTGVGELRYSLTFTLPR